MGTANDDRAVRSRARIAGELRFAPIGRIFPPGNALFSTFFEAKDVFHEGAIGNEIDLPVCDRLRRLGGRA